MVTSKSCDSKSFLKIKRLFLTQYFYFEFINDLTPTL